MARSKGCLALTDLLGGAVGGKVIELVTREFPNGSLGAYSVVGGVNVYDMDHPAPHTIIGLQLKKVSSIDSLALELRVDITNDTVRCTEHYLRDLDDNQLFRIWDNTAESAEVMGLAPTIGERADMAVGNFYRTRLVCLGCKRTISSVKDHLSAKASCAAAYGLRTGIDSTRMVAKARDLLKNGDGMYARALRADGDATRTGAVRDFFAVVNGKSRAYFARGFWYALIEACPSARSSTAYAKLMVAMLDFTVLYPMSEIVTDIKVHNDYGADANDVAKMIVRFKAAIKVRKPTSRPRKVKPDGGYFGGMR